MAVGSLVMGVVKGERSAWERLPGESALWHDRFWSYVQLGPVQRSVEACYRSRRNVETALVGVRAPSDWSRHARRFDWENRAAVYDDTFRRQMAERDADRRLWAREKRLTAIEEMLDLVMSGIRAAKLDEIDEASEDVLGTERARRLLGVFRAFAHDLLVAHRLELGEPTAIEQRRQVELSADDLAGAQALLDGWEAALVPFRPVRPEREVSADEEAQAGGGE